MGEQQIRYDLDKLRAEIDGLESNDQDKQKLTALVADIEMDLENLEAADFHSRTKTKIETMINQFETSHPTVTGILNNVMVTLSGMGV